MLKTFICLANSRKEGGRCVAGVTLDNLNWFRPVSSKEHGELDLSHYTLDDGTEASILDIIRVDVLHPVPEPHQPENWLLNEAYQWELIERISRDKAYLFLIGPVSTDEYIFGDPSDSIACSQIDEGELENSLCLIEPSDISWKITRSSRGSRQMRAQFTYNENDYDLVVTDPKWKKLFATFEYGTYVHNELLWSNVSGSADTMLFTISLALPFHNKYYKLVTGVLRL